MQQQRAHAGESVFTGGDGGGRGGGGGGGGRRVGLSLYRTYMKVLVACTSHEDGSFRGGVVAVVVSKVAKNCPRGHIWWKVAMELKIAKRVYAKLKC